jgi:hypothetical protein
LSQEVYIYGDSVFYNVSVRNDLDEKRRFRHHHGYRRPDAQNPSHRDLLMPDILPRRRYGFYGDLQGAGELLQRGCTVFFVNRDGRREPRDCSVSDGVRFSG